MDVHLLYINIMSLLAHGVNSLAYSMSYVCVSVCVVGALWLNA